VVEQTAPRKVYFEFTGGEVTLYRDFVEICQYVKSLGAKVGLISNGSRTLRWWEENKQYFDHLCISYHPEFAEPDHFINVVKLLHNDVRTHVNIMMSPEKFDQCFDIADRLKDVNNISIALQPLIVDFGDTLYEYTEDQQRIIDNQYDLIVKHIKFDRNFEYQRGAMAMLQENGNKIPKSAHRFINDKTNDWSGWNCYSGVEQIIVDLGGHIFRGWCRVGGKIGHINDPDLRIPTDPVLCHKTMCHCNFDIMSTKEKING
jgi:FMN phosphatase YigB (HAD superfamily)